MTGELWLRYHPTACMETMDRTEKLKAFKNDRSVFAYIVPREPPKRQAKRPAPADGDDASTTGTRLVKKAHRQASPSSLMGHQTASVAIATSSESETAPMGAGSNNPPSAGQDAGIASLDGQGLREYESTLADDYGPVDHGGIADLLSEDGPAGVIDMARDSAGMSTSQRDPNVSPVYTCQPDGLASLPHNA